MKICILSMQRVQNFGSLLQSFALKKTLEQLGHQVSFLDIERREDDNLLLSVKSHSFPQEGFRRGFLAKLKKLDRYTANRIWIKARNRKQLREMDNFRTSVLGVQKAANDDHYDCCIIGSDEVFNCMTGASWGFTGQLFGDVKQAEKVITYAASAGATVLEEIPEAAQQRIREAFLNISAFSVRDGNTNRLVSALTDEAVTEHLDPVLTSDFEEEVQNVKLPDNLSENFCLIYSYYNRIHRREEIDAIKKFCKQHDLKIVTAGSPQMWTRNHLVVDPFALMNVFSAANFVITDTFHGTIFSAKYAKRFAVLIRGSNQNKLGDLITKLDVHQHRVTSFDQLDTAYSAINDTGRITALCSRERDRTIRYLQENL